MATVIACRHSPPSTGPVRGSCRGLRHRVSAALRRVIAATIAFAASRYQARVQRSAQRKEQWWKRAEWALNLTLSDDSDQRAIGLQMLDALAQSEWTHEREQDVIAAAVNRHDPLTPSIDELSKLQLRSHEGNTDDESTTDPGVAGTDC
ncbi:hypothetical protein ACEXOS_003715 [Herbiconiux sp. P16]|uniref:hypothetical protein n=1 Tax=Herbiconiux wuyangfengii TaxID=3342794 RepID=UPI0035BA6D13